MSTAKLVLDGKEHELPVVVGSEGEVGIDISKLRDKSGAITLDDGYGAIVSFFLERDGIEMGEKISAQVSMPISTTFRADLSLEVTLISFALGLSMAALGALLPSIRAAGIQPVDAMRSHR